jgi:hypothetical protein
MTKNRILVYDDEEQFTTQIRSTLSGVEAVNEQFEVNALSEDDFDAAMKELAARNRCMRKDTKADRGDCRFDEADIAIIDQDLLDSRVGQFLTGEDVAYLLRCFSSCELVVVLNQFDKRGQSSFDLTLRGNPDSFADLNVGSEQINNPNLWGGKRSGFFPWHWPLLPKYLKDFRRRVNDVKAALNESNEPSIRDVLGMSEDLFALLPRSAAQFLGNDPENVTFREFVRNSGNALRRKDSDTTPDEVLARVGAARISKWLERVVLPAQSILVDAPHLVSRYPSLLNENTRSMEAWNNTARRELPDHGRVIVGSLAKHRFSRAHWLSRPAWVWPEVSSDREIPEVNEPWTTSQTPFCFCEDASRFYRPTDCERFVAEVDSPFVQRFVKRFSGVDYRPAVRFAM